MNIARWISLTACAALIAGCAGSADNKPAAQGDSSKIAEAQRFCVVDNDNRLGAMGPPDKYVIKDKDGKEQPVFVCCGGCIKTIKKDEAKTLAVAEELRKKYGQPISK